MTDEISNLILEWMRRLDGRLDRMEARIGDVERQLALLRSDVHSLHGYQRLNDERTAGLESRIERIERRLDPVRD